MNKINIKKYICLLTLIFFKITLSFSTYCKQEKKELILYAPISLSQAINEVLANYAINNKGVKVNSILMGTSQLAMQIKNGAKPDVFISANQGWMDYLENRELILQKFRKNFLYNSLVLITQKSNEIEKIQNVDHLKKLLINTKTKISLAMIKSIPAGIYAKSYLENIKIWPQVKNNFVESINVRAALNFVARGDLEFGIVYKSDAFASNKVKVVYYLEREKHNEIIYPIAVLNNKYETLDFYNFLLSKNTLSVISKWGFDINND